MTRVECKACMRLIEDEYVYCPWCGFRHKWDSGTVTSRAHITFGANGK